MRLESLKISGFRGLREFEYQFRPDRAFLLFGLNGTGKSSLFQALHLGVLGSVFPVSVLENPGAEVLRHRALPDKDSAEVKIDLLRDGNRLSVSRSLLSDGTIRSNFSGGGTQALCEDQTNRLCFLTRNRFSRLIDSVDRDRWDRLSPLLGHEELAAFREGLRLLWRNLRKDLGHRFLSDSAAEADRNRDRLEKELKELPRPDGVVEVSPSSIQAALSQIGISLEPPVELKELDWDGLRKALPGGIKAAELAAESQALVREAGIIEPEPISREDLTSAVSLLETLHASPSLAHDLLHADF